MSISTIAFSMQAFSAALSLAMMIFSIVRGKRNALLFSYITCIALIFIWTLAQVMDSIFPKQTGDDVFAAMRNFSTCFIGICWFVFCLFYTQHKLLQMKAKNLVFFILPALFFAATLTNPMHHLFFQDNPAKEPAVLFWINALSNYTFIIAGAILLFRNIRKSRGHLQKQAIFLSLSIVLPVTSNLITLTDLIIKGDILNLGLDMTPVSFSFSLLFFAIATFRYQFLNISYLAYSRVFSNLREACIVVDAHQRIILSNEEFSRNFGSYPTGNRTKRLQRLIRTLSGNVVGPSQRKTLLGLAVHPSKEAKSFEITLKGSNEEVEHRIYQVQSQPILSYDALVGQVITFHNVTHYKSLLLNISEKNEELTALNQQLQEYAEKVEELTLTKERNRFARDIHDTLGHSMALLIRMLEATKLKVKVDAESAEKSLEDAVEIAREGLRELRRSISGLTPSRLESTNLTHAIHNLINDFKPSGMHIELSVEGTALNINPAVSDAVYRVCQESLTNSLRHGKAQSVNIILKFAEQYVKLFIIDDGVGAKNIKPGFGLRGMTERIQNVGGKIFTGSDGECGFHIRAEIPIA